MTIPSTLPTFGSSVAENYERYFVPLIPAPLAADLVDRAGLRPGEHVIDVACGTGVVARLATDRVGPRGRVVGVDPSLAMIEAARARPAPSGPPIEWREAPAEALPLPDDSFDFALCQLGLMFLADRLAGLREMRRVLAPGGRVAINVPGPPPPLFAAFEDALACHGGSEAARFVGAIFSLHDAGHLHGLLQQAGFGDITTELVTFPLRLPPPVDFLWQYVHSTPLATVLAGAGDEEREALERDLVGRWREFVDGEGMAFDLPMVVATGQT